MEAQGYRGVLVDHLIDTCPAMRRAKNQGCTHHGPATGCCPGFPLLGTVDVDGPDLCGWCVRVFKARNR